MNQRTKQLLLITSTFAFLLGANMLLAKTISSPENQPPLYFLKAKDLRLINPDSAILVFQQFYLNAITKGDTSLAIDALLELAFINGHQANYKESYDKLWTGLLLADEANLLLKKAVLYKAIGRYYSFYKRKDKALKFLELSLEINRELVKKGELPSSRLAQIYHGFCSTYRELHEQELYRTYLDSCFMVHSPSESHVSGSFLKFEKAILFHRDERYKEALALFKEVKPWFYANSPGALVLFYAYFGDTYKALNNFSESEDCYQKALEFSSKYHSHIDFTPLVYERLSDLYYNIGNHFKAYNSLRKAKELDAIFFDSRSKNNGPLLEIQDAFRQEKEKQVVLLREQRLSKLEQEKQVAFLEKIILIGCTIFLGLIGIMYFNYVRSKFRAEKQLIDKKRELEIQKANEIVEVKNKELTASALKLIEKEAFIDALKEKLSQGKGDIKRQEVKQIVSLISNSSTENWKEFEARFVSVNKRFYERLNQKFPILTQGDKKLCALVKLNFSSKEMAKLLGMSVESVHTTRYRLRKKLKLSRDVNLKEFIASI